MIGDRKENERKDGGGLKWREREEEEKKREEDWGKERGEKQAK